MILEDTKIVRPKDARPAGSPDKCFYCGESMGEAHKPDCVIVRRTVVIEMTMDMVVSVPNDWDTQLIEFQKNESSWCSSSIIDDLADWRNKVGGCICSCTEFEFIREATEEDHRELPVLTRGD